jgi:pteridine reductase
MSEQPSPSVRKLALVTGAGVRLGRASALRLAAAGFDLLVHYNSSDEPARRTADEVRQTGREAHLMQADLASAEGVDRLAAQVAELSPGLDVLVNNAAIFYPSVSPEDWIEHWDHFHWVNLKSPFLLTVKLLPLLRQRKGCVVNIVDIWSRYPLKRFLPYSVAKSGLEALTRALALELAPDIRVNGVSPGAALPASGADGNVDKMLTQVPLKRLGGAEAIAQAVEFLCRADYVTGQVLPVDGGRTINL